MQFIYHIEGMHCASCILKIEAALSPHFKNITVTLHPPRLAIETNNQPSLDNLNKYIASAGNYEVHAISQNAAAAEDNSETGFRAYYPIFLIALYLIVITAINNFHEQGINWHGWMNQFMAGFFFVFSGFKLLDIHGFAEGYSTYDLLAKYWYGYGYIYPFLELSLGFLYLTNTLPTITQLATIFIMGFSSLGVINSLLKKQKFQCACLGTILKVPLSSITLVEDLTMVVLAIVGLILQ